MEEANNNQDGASCIDGPNFPKQKSKDWFTRFIRKEKGETSTHPSDEEHFTCTEVEEEEEGALYNTTFKRVHYNTDICFKQWEMVKLKHIKAGTLEKLVEHLTPADIESNEADTGFFSAFLCTYKSFSTPSEVIELLLKRFEACETNILSSNTKEECSFKGIMRRVCAVIITWLHQYPHDFDEPVIYPTLANLRKFTEKRLTLPGIQELHNACRDTLDKFIVSPFDYDVPYRFKSCPCSSVVGCTCETPTCRVTYEHQKSLHIGQFSAELIANQLTLADSELFLRVSPRECLGYFWSKRDSSKGSMSKSIKLTVDQFNAVSLKVISTILSAKDKQTDSFSASSRCKMVGKWIDVALELRELKNFSSLKSILCSLQSSAIYRLTKTWQIVNKRSIEIYNELSKIFVDDMNNKASRELLRQEGTAKFSTHKLLKKTQSKRNMSKKEGMTCGTVPYLGTFLTDLMMIDTAYPDKCKGDLINFQKKRKEFETIAQIKLFQEAAKGYHIQACKDFFIWFNKIPEYGEKEGYNKSLEVEPPIPKVTRFPSTPEQKRKDKQTLKKSRSENDLIDIANATHSLDSCDGSSPALTSKHRHVSIKDRGRIKSSPGSRSELTCGSIGDIDPHRTSSLSPTDIPSPRGDTSFIVARVYLEDSNGSQCKTIKVDSTTRTCDVISVTLRTFEVTEEESSYCLQQILDNERTLNMPVNSNIYYAMSKSTKNLRFKVCKGRGKCVQPIAQLGVNLN